MLRRTTSNHNGDFNYLNCFHSFSTENRLRKHERACNDHDYCHVEMLNEDKEILKYNRGEKSMKVPFMTDVDLESLLEKTLPCQNNPKKYYIEKKLSIHLLVTQRLQVVYLMQQKTNLIITEGKTVWKGFSKI